MKDNIFEIDMPRGSDAEARMLATSGADIVAAVGESTALLRKVYGGDPLPRLDAEHRGIMASVAEGIDGKAGNVVEQAALWGMVANTAISTMWGVIDWANGQAEILDMTEGGDD